MIKASPALSSLSALLLFGAFALPGVSQAEPLQYETTLSVTTRDSWEGGSKALPEYLEVGDRFNFAFTIDGAATYTAFEPHLTQPKWIFGGAITSLSLYPDAGNAGSFGSIPPVLNLASSRLEITKQGFTPSYRLEVFFELATPLEVGFSYPSGYDGTGPFQTTVGSASLIMLNRFMNLPDSPGADQPLSEILSYLNPYGGVYLDLHFSNAALLHDNPEAQYLFVPMASLTAIPEPGSFALLGVAGAAMLFFRKRRR